MLRIPDDGGIRSIASDKPSLQIGHGDPFSGTVAGGFALLAIAFALKNQLLSTTILKIAINHSISKIRKVK